MKKLIKYSSAALLAAMAVAGCNSSDISSEIWTSSTAAVGNFSLQADKKVLANLDTVFFCIDQNAAQIFNPDSLPYGTTVKKLVPNITPIDLASAITLTYKTDKGQDTTVNYVTNSTDSINFANGPVKLAITSYDKVLTREYTVKVNVHTVKPDSMAWSRAANRSLPSIFNVPNSQSTARTDKGFYCLTSYQGNYCMAFAEDPNQKDWHKETATIPSGAHAESFIGSEDKLYILADDGINDGKFAVYESTDSKTWTKLPYRVYSLIGAYGKRLLGTIPVGEKWFICDLSDGSTTEMPSGMPVEGYSRPVSLSFPLSAQKLMMVIGGRCADGSFSSDVWAYDGSTWAKTSNTPLPKGFRDMCLVPFFTFNVSTTFVVTEYTTLLAFGGNNGMVNNGTVYQSRDYGMTWTEASELMQLPSAVPAMSQSQAYVANQKYYSRNADEWVEFPCDYLLPSNVNEQAWYPFMSRATKPVEEWECPFIYVFGGESAEGVLYNTIWRATINRLLFKPLI